MSLLAFTGAAVPLLLIGTGGGAEAQAPRVASDDPRLLNSTEGFRTRHGRATGYLTRPRGAAAPRPGVIVIHGSDGLTSHYRDVARRIALEGFVVFAPDFLSLAEEAPEDQDAAREMIEALDDGTALVMANSAVEFLVTRRDTLRRAGVVGFSWGGGLALELALESQDVTATVSFYGGLLEPQRASRLRAPLMVHHAGHDNDAAGQVEELREALEAAAIEHRVHVYEGVDRGFHDDTSGAYDQEAAELAWERTISFLNETLQ